MLRLNTEAPGRDSPNHEDLARAEARCESGSAEYCLYLGWHLWRGRLEHRDEPRAYRRIERACSLQLESACVELAWMEELGRGVPHDLPQALARYRAACAEEGSLACEGAARVQRLVEDRERMDALPAPQLPIPVPGGLDKGVIAAVIRSRQPYVRFCYERELAWQHRLEGRLKVEFRIGPLGSVVNAFPSPSVEPSTLPPEMVTCILDQVRSWRFPPPKGGGVVTVTFPWIFTVDRNPIGGLLRQEAQFPEVYMVA